MSFMAFHGLLESKLEWITTGSWVRVRMLGVGVDTLYKLAGSGAPLQCSITLRCRAARSYECWRASEATATISVNRSPALARHGANRVTKCSNCRKAVQCGRSTIATERPPS